MKVSTGSTRPPQSLERPLRDARPLAFHPRVTRLEHEGRHLVVKKARGSAAGSEDLARELRANLIASSARTPDDDPLCSAPLWYDDAHLVFDADPGDMTLQDALTASWDTGHARRCGALIATTHTLDPHDLPTARPERPRLFPLTAEEYATTSDQSIAMLRLLEEHPEARRALESVQRPAAEATVLVHGDLKPDNVLLGPGDSGRPHLIDWELAGRGDPHEDLAAFLAGVLASSLNEHIRRSRADRPEEIARALNTSAAASFRYFALLMEGYRSVRDMEPDLDHLLPLMGSRLLCRAQSLATLSSQVGAVPTVLLLATTGMLTDVATSAERLRTVLTEGART